MIHPIILCGGSGTRLWPSSRAAFPKQFAPLLGERTLYQDTLTRFATEGFAAPLVMTNDNFRFLATEQARKAGLMDTRVVVEPLLRDTAAAILTAVLMCSDDPEALVLISPSDHVVADPIAFRATIQVGVAAARAGQGVVFGITPDRPATEYGYLHLDGAGQPDVPVRLHAFVEKPDAATAAGFVAGGQHLWNAGVFLFRRADLIAAFASHAPDLIDPCERAVAQGAEDLDFFRLAQAPYAQARKISFDYAVMERAENLVCVPFSGAWSDLGSWDAVWRAGPRDGDGVGLSGPATAISCHDTFLRSEEDTMQIVGIGLTNVVAVAMRDAVLVADMAHLQSVKRAVEVLKARQISQAEEYPRFHRPWGWYETLVMGPRFQVKRIMVKPGGVLSLQSHVHRSEHWVVVSGTAEVTIGEKIRLVTENQSVYIPLGTVHRMANPGRLPMYLIEVQTGAYLGEDDIKRYEDVYNRT